MQSLRRRSLAAATASVFLEHDLCGLDDGLDLVADLELQCVNTAASDDALNQIVSNPDGDVSHDLAEKYLLDTA